MSPEISKLHTALKTERRKVSIVNSDIWTSDQILGSRTEGWGQTKMFSVTLSDFFKI